MARTIAQELRIARKCLENARQWEKDARASVNVAWLTADQDADLSAVYEDWENAIKSMRDGEAWIAYLHSMAALRDKNKADKAARAAARAAQFAAKELGR